LHSCNIPVSDIRSASTHHPTTQSASFFQINRRSTGRHCLHHQLCSKIIVKYQVRTRGTTQSEIGYRYIIRWDWASSHTQPWRWRRSSCLKSCQSEAIKWRGSQRGEFSVASFSLKG